MSACPKRTDAQFEQGTAAGTAAHAAVVREWIKTNLSDAGSELRTIDQHELKTGAFGNWYEKGKHGHSASNGCSSRTDGSFEW